MLVLAMEFSRGMTNGRPKAACASRRQVAGQEAGIAFCPRSKRSQKTEQRGPDTGGPVREVETFNDTDCLASRIASASTGSSRTLCWLYKRWSYATNGCKQRRPEQELLRKEVIQPHLPVRLPCYDFTPITDPTFDSSLLAVGPLASGVTDFRGVTGGVYKARERIHPGVADPGLLATPTSWSRVADSNPN